MENTLSIEKSIDQLQREKDREQIEKTIDDLTLFDDDLFAKVMDENFEATTLLLKIILKREDIEVTYVKGQEEMKSNIYGGRTIRLDIRAKFADGTQTNIEVQRSTAGSNVRRSRFHSSMLDTRMLKESEEFKMLKDSYVIFICEHDKFQKNLPMYHIERYIQETGEIINDGSHIIYVNGKYRGDDEIGVLMKDFSCKASKDITYKVLANGVKHFKETEEGREIMCESFEKLASEREKRYSKKIAEKLLAAEKMSVEEIAEMTELSIEEVEEIAGLQTV